MEKIFTTEIVNEIIRKRNFGEKISRNEKIWYQNIDYVRKDNLLFLFTNEELLEYSKCAHDPIYFIEKYCKTRLDTGMVNNIVLRDYQKEMIKKFKKNRFQLYFHSRQMGVSAILSLLFLHYITFNIDKNVHIIGFNHCNCLEIIKKIKTAYLSLPFFLKKGVSQWTNNKITFDNGCRIFSHTKKNVGIGCTINILYIQDMGYFSTDDAKNLYDSLFPTVSSISDSRMIISGGFGFNFFYTLLQDSERDDGDPKKNNIFKTMRMYWWQVPGRDEKWKQNEIKIIGEELFEREYDLMFNPLDKYTLRELKLKRILDLD